VMQVAPSDVVTLQAIRSAMGVSCEPAAGNASVEMSNFPSVGGGETSSNKQQELDADINDFFAQGTAEQPIVL